MTRKWTKTAGILFMAAAATYSGQVILAGAASPTKADAAKAAADNADPFAPASAKIAAKGATASSQPTSQPSGEVTAKPSQGQSVTATQVNVSDAGTVEIHVNDASLVEVLRMLSLQSQKNIIASKDVHGSITANLYDVTVREALDAILHANGYDYREKGNFIYVYTTKEIEDQEKKARVTKTEVFHLYYTPALNALTMIKPVLSAEGQVASTTPAKTGIDEGGKDVGGNDHATDDLLVITDYPDNLEKVRRILKEVDRRPQQILVEAVILRATLTENNSLGVDFTALAGVNFNTINNIGTQTSTNTNSNLSNALTGGILENPDAGGVFHNGYGSVKAGGSGLQLGFVKNNIGLFIQALEGVTDTVVLANPKLLVLNKQKGEVHVGSEQGYKTAITTDTITATDVKYLETGTRLVFRPYVGDNGYIRLEVHPEDSSGAVNDQGLPNKAVTQVTSNVMVRDGHTIVIGGLFRDATTRTRSQVPLLGSLPGIGAAFRSQQDSTTREEVIILLTPHIVKDESAYTAASEEEMKNAERIRVGHRRGLMPWGRERLAEAWYENAVREMNKPHPNRDAAMWHLNCAINLNPHFTEAMELRSQVSGKEVSATDGSAIRGFVKGRILEERMHPVPVDPTMTPTTVPTKGTDGNADGSRSTAATPSTQPVAEAPATQPTASTLEAEMVEDPADAPTTPATQESPKVAGANNATPPSAVKWPQRFGQAPTTAPSVATKNGKPGDNNSKGTAVTSLPDDSVEDGTDSSDQK